MKRTAIVISLTLAAALTGATGVSADPCLIVYPTAPALYMYDTSEYYTVGPGHPLYDAAYDRGGEVLLETNTDEIDHTIYQAPGLYGFMPSWEGLDGYFFNENPFTIVVDAFSNKPRIFRNVVLVFDWYDRADCDPRITVNGVRIASPVVPIGDIAALTPAANGNNYSDTRELEITWHYCEGLRIWAFADEDFDGARDGGECFTAFSHDITIGTESSSWGAIKGFYR